MRRYTSTITAASLAALLTLSLAAPAMAANPNDNSSCVAEIFVPQASEGEPGAIAARIHEIMSFIDIPWGQVVSNMLARWDGCRE